MSIWASAEKVEYRLKVFTLLKENKDNKYPAFAEFYANSKKEGTLFDSMCALFMVCDRHFADNMTISTCANRVEEITIMGRKAAEDLFTQYLQDMSKDETIH
jgi:hypothetical protein